jgi:hypothetical protein
VNGNSPHHRWQEEAETQEVGKKGEQKLYY